MNLRVIKKEIEYCIGAFIDDCTIFAALNPGCDTDGVNALADEAVALYNALRDKVNNLPEELKHKTSPKHQHRDKKEIATEKAELRKKLNAYYDGIRTEMIEKLDELNKKLSEAIKTPKKPAAKKAPAKKTAPKVEVKEVAEEPAVEEVAEKPAEEKVAEEKPAAKKAPAKKADAEEKPAAKTTAKKAPAKKATTEETAEKKPAAKKAPAKKAAPKKEEEKAE